MRRRFLIPGRMQALRKSKAGWLRTIPARAALLMAVAWASFGCEADSFVPPVNPELRGDADATQVAATYPIELVLDQRDPDLLEAWKSAARMQAGLDKVKLHILALDLGDPKSKQADLVREALNRHPRVLVVEPADPADHQLAQAVEDVRGQGIPVVLAGWPLAGVKADSSTGDATATKSNASPGHRAAIIVVEPHFAGPAKQLVTAAIRVAQNCDLQPTAGALLVTNASDSFVPQREQAIKDALKAAGINTIEELRLANDMQASEKLFKERLAAKSKLAMVFAVDSASSTVVREVVSNDTSGRIVITAGFASEDQVSSMMRAASFAAVADFTPTRLIRKAISTAVALTQGRETPSVVEFRINVSESTLSPAELKAQFLQRQQPKKEPEKEDEKKEKK